jgi:hypothetical protein
MEQEQYLIREQEMKEILSSDIAEALDDPCRLEDISLSIREMKDKIEWYKIYKKNKNDSIKQSVEKLEDKIVFLKSIIFNTLKETVKKKTLTFPGTCRVTATKSQPKWNIGDEDVLIKFAEEEKELDNISEKIDGYKILKDKAKKVFADWEKSGKLDQIVDKDGKKVVTKESGSDSVSITFLDKDKDKDDVEYSHIESVVDDMDSL